MRSWTGAGADRQSAAPKKTEMPWRTLRTVRIQHPGRAPDSDYPSFPFSSPGGPAGAPVHDDSLAGGVQGVQAVRVALEDISSVARMRDELEVHLVVRDSARQSLAAVMPDFPPAGVGVGHRVGRAGHVVDLDVGRSRAARGLLDGGNVVAGEADHAGRVAGVLARPDRLSSDVGRRTEQDEDHAAVGDAPPNFVLGEVLVGERGPLLELLAEFVLRRLRPGIARLPEIRDELGAGNRVGELAEGAALLRRHQEAHGTVPPRLR